MFVFHSVSDFQYYYIDFFPVKVKTYTHLRYFYKILHETRIDVQSY